MSFQEMDAAVDINLPETLMQDKANKYVEAILEWAERQDDVKKYVMWNIHLNYLTKNLLFQCVVYNITIYCNFNRIEDVVLEKLCLTC